MATTNRPAAERRSPRPRLWMVRRRPLLHNIPLSDLSKAERRTDWKVSTLAAILEGMGLRVRVVALDEDGNVAETITPLDTP